MLGFFLPESRMPIGMQPCPLRLLRANYSSCGSFTQLGPLSPSSAAPPFPLHPLRPPHKQKKRPEGRFFKSYLRKVLTYPLA